MTISHLTSRIMRQLDDSLFSGMASCLDSLEDEFLGLLDDSDTSGLTQPFDDWVELPHPIPICR